MVGDEITDPILASLQAKPYFPQIAAGYKNQKGVWEHAQHAENFSVAVKEIAGTYYVGAHTTPYNYIYAGVNNDVNYTKVNGIVNIYNAKYDNKGEILGNIPAYELDGVTYHFDWLDPKYVNTDAPEGQFLVSWDKQKGVFTLTNRESQEVFATNLSLKTVKDKDGNVIAEIHKNEIYEMIHDGSISGGMIPKVLGCLESIDGGVTGAHIIDGRIPHCLLLEIFTKTGIGTLIKSDKY